VVSAAGGLLGAALVAIEPHAGAAWPAVLLARFVGAVAVGAAAQWAVLRRLIGGAWRWVAATAAGAALAAVVLVAYLLAQADGGHLPAPGSPGWLAAAAVGGAWIGLVTGLAQWLVLRADARSPDLWLAASIGGWTMLLETVAGAPGVGLVARVAIGAVAYGGVTGLGLVWLFRRRPSGAPAAGA
jgi:hypothetical protein